MHAILLVSVSVIVGGGVMPEVEDVDFDDAPLLAGNHTLPSAYWLFPLNRFFIPTTRQVIGPDLKAIREQAIRDAAGLDFKNSTENAVRSARREASAGSLVDSETTRDFRLYLGGVLDALDVKWLRANHIGAVLNLIQMTPRYFQRARAEFTDSFTAYSPLLLPSSELEHWYAKALGVANSMYLNAPIDEESEIDLLTVLPQAFRFIDEARARHLNLLIHSHAGQNRAAAIVVAWLLREEADASLGNIIEGVQSVRGRLGGLQILANSKLANDVISYCMQTRPEEKCRLPPGY